MMERRFVEVLFCEERALLFSSSDFGLERSSSRAEPGLVPQRLYPEDKNDLDAFSFDLNRRIVRIDSF